MSSAARIETLGLVADRLVLMVSAAQMADLW
jgi:hypothetical protein